MTAQAVTKALGGRKAGVGWMERCPAHDDQTPSLSICDAEGSMVLVRCHAGCDQERPNTVPLPALPREERDLFIAANNGHVLAFDNVSGLRDWNCVASLAAEP
jgi:hypothetical protein